MDYTKKEQQFAIGDEVVIEHNYGGDYELGFSHSQIEHGHTPIVPQKGFVRDISITGNRLLIEYNVEDKTMCLSFDKDNCRLVKRSGAKPVPVKTTYKPVKDFCVVTGKLSNILNTYQNRDVSRFNMSLTGYKKFMAGGKKWTNKSIKSEDKGIIVSDRTFGVELECTTDNYNSRAIADFLINPNYEAETDGSVSGINREYKTPIMQNKAGEDSLMETCAMLQKVGFTTNNTCGTHVHIGVPEAKALAINTKNQERLKNLLLFYTVFDDAIFKLLPPSRRNNRFCYQIKDRYNQSHIDKLKADKRFDFFWYATTNEDRLREYKSESRYGETRIDRYTGINLNSLSLRGTVEVRYHQGTLDAPTLITWIDFHAGIIDFIMSGAIDEQQIEELKTIKDTRELLITVLGLMKSFVNKKTIKAIVERYDLVNSPSYKDPVPAIVVDEDADEDDYDEEDDDY